MMKKVRMVVWGLTWRRKIKLLQLWVKSPDEDTRTMAYMLLSILAEAKEMDDGSELD
jgi:hypothetical protein